VTEAASDPSAGDDPYDKTFRRIVKSPTRLSRRAAVSLLKEARSLKAEGRAVDALDLQMRVQRAISDRYGADDPFAVGIKEQVAATLFDLERWESALEVYRQLARTYRRLQGSKDPRYLKVQVWEGLILGHLERPDEALAILTDAVQASEDVLGEDSDELANYMTILARAEAQCGLNEAALESIRVCLDIRSRVLGEADPLTIASLRDLTRLLYEEGALDEAKILASSLVVRSTECYGPDHERTRQAGELLEQIDRTA
jgi:eukaryotic-like serine/threonine-protein kinase